MKKFSILVFALFALSNAAFGQNTVTDSVRMDLKVYQYQFVDGIWLNCGAGIYATWPDVRTEVLNQQSTYSSYGRVATDGQFVPYGYGEAVDNPQFGISVPAGSFGHNPQLGGASSGPAYLGSGGCGAHVAGARSRLSGAEALLNGKPFRVTEWYATYQIPAGTPIADFTWSQPTGSDIAFDATFPTSREVEVTGRVPVASYEWTVDGTTYTDAAFTHTFDEPGTYPVTLTVTDDDDETDSITKDVTVKGVVLEYRVFATEKVGVSDTLFMFATIKNTGAETAKEISVSRLVLQIPSYPDATSAHARDAESTALLPIADTTFTNVEPGAAVAVYQNFAITKTAEGRPADDNTWVPIPVDWELDLVNLKGVNADDLEAEIVNLCDSRDCDNTTRIEAKDMEVSILSTRIDGEATEVHSGLTRWIGGVFVKGVFFHLVPPYSSELQCNSGCVDLEITVEEPDGRPVEGAVVKLTRVLLDSDPEKKSIVTPGQGGGIFCFESECGAELTLPPTDAFGKQKARFWTPGVTKPVQAFLETEVSKIGYNTTKGEDRVVDILPSPLDFVSGTANPTDLDMTALDIIAALQYASDLPDLDSWCKKANSWFASTSTSAFGLKLDGVWKTAVSKGIGKLCGGALSKYVFDEEFARDDEIELRKDHEALLGLFQKITDVLGLYWFQSQFNLALVGTGTTTLTKSPPFISHSSEFVDTIKEANQAIAKQSFFSGSSVPPTIMLDIFEVSHKKEDTESVNALYFALKTTPDLDPKVDYKHLITKDYNKSLFLTQEAAISATETETAETDESLTLASPSGKRYAADDSTFSVGHVLVVDPGLDTQEFVQVESITGSTLALTMPMKHGHEAGAVVAYVDSLAIAEPGQPYSTSGLSGIGGVSRSPQLTWRLFEPVSSFTVEVATDTLFQEIVQAHSSVPDTVLVLDELADRTRYYWHVAGTNASGQGEWSERYSFFTGRPIGDDLAEAFPMTDELDAIRFAWNYGATGESGEVTSSCGGGTNSLWYSYDPAASGTVAFDTFISGFDTEISVWTGTAHPLTEVACNDDYENGEHPAILQSYLEFEAVAGQRYYLRISGKGDAKGALFLELRAPTTVSTEPAERFQMESFDLGAYPNPTTGRATIIVDLPNRAPVKVNVYDLLGRRKTTLIDATLPAGRHQVIWDAGDVPAGMYVVVADNGSGSVSSRLTVVR